MHRMKRFTNLEVVPNVDVTVHGSGIRHIARAKSKRKHGLHFDATTKNSALAKQLRADNRPKLDVLYSTGDKLKGGDYSIRTCFQHTCVYFNLSVRVGAKLCHKYTPLFSCARDINTGLPLMHSDSKSKSSTRRVIAVRIFIMSKGCCTSPYCCVKASEDAASSIKYKRSRIVDADGKQ